MPDSLSISVEAGQLHIHSAQRFPRLERAFARSAGAGMLDLLRHGLPLGAGPFPAWLREKAQELLMQPLQRISLPLRNKKNRCTYVAEYIITKGQFLTSLCPEQPPYKRTSYTMLGA